MQVASAGCHARVMQARVTAGDPTAGSVSCVSGNSTSGLESPFSGVTGCGSRPRRRPGGRRHGDARPLPHVPQARCRGSCRLRVGAASRIPEPSSRRPHASAAPRDTRRARPRPPRGSGHKQPLSDRRPAWGRPRESVAVRAPQLPSPGPPMQTRRQTHPDAGRPRPGRRGSRGQSEGEHGHSPKGPGEGRKPQLREPRVQPASSTRRALRHRRPDTGPCGLGTVPGPAAAQPETSVRLQLV